MIKVRDFELSLKDVGKNGTFSGYGSVFDVVDAQKERVLPGAFVESIAARKAKGRKFPVLWQHRTENPIGVYEHIEEDSKGLYVEGKLLTEEVGQAREAHALMKSGAVSGLSIGYWTRESSFDEKTGIRSLSRLDLEEISIVTLPSNDEARVDAIKMKLAHGGLPTIREFESILREAGFSKSQAAVIANRGIKALLRDAAEEPANETAAALIERIRGFTLPPI